MLWFGYARALRDLKAEIARLDERMRAIETDNPAQIAAMINAADLLKRAAARWERSGPKNGDGSDDGAATSIDEIRRRRGGF